MFKKYSIFYTYLNIHYIVSFSIILARCYSLLNEVFKTEYSYV